MNSCKYCHALVIYSLIDRTFMYDCKKYFMYGMCYECSLVYSDMFQLKIADDKKIKDDELNKMLQPF